ncbi:hypothetical protein MN608_02554 [Microdochium nivale]|nr:hypothetical protein MN608_02554 [Microdochium nivale]
MFARAALTLQQTGHNRPEAAVSGLLLGAGGCTRWPSAGTPPPEATLDDKVLALVRPLFRPCKDTPPWTSPLTLEPKEIPRRVVCIATLDGFARAGHLEHGVPSSTLQPCLSLSTINHQPA